MGLESVNYQCPACGGPLRYDGGKGKLVCDHCDSEFEVAQIEAMFATAEAKAEERAAGAGAQTLDGGYVCASCGAQLMTDGTVAVSRCPYCGNQTMQAATFEATNSRNYMRGDDEIIETDHSSCQRIFSLMKSSRWGTHMRTRP